MHIPCICVAEFGPYHENLWVSTREKTHSATTIAQTFSSYIQFDCEGYALSDTFYRTEIELLVFKLYQVLFG